MDLERLDDALDYMDWLRNVAADWPDVEEKGGVIIAAARAYRDLLANGERVFWCDEHNAPQWRDDKCYTVLAIESRGSARFNTCRIVTRLVIDPPTEEE